MYTLTLVPQLLKECLNPCYNGIVMYNPKINKLKNYMIYYECKDSERERRIKYRNSVYDIFYSEPHPILFKDSKRNQ